MNKLSLIAVALSAAAAGCLGGESGRPFGQACTDVDQCAPPLVCSQGHCRAQCQLDVDCPTGYHCLPSLGACTVPDEEGCVTDGCDHDFVCVDDVCRDPCEGVSCPSGYDCLGGGCVGQGGDGDADADNEDCDPHCEEGRCGDDGCGGTCTCQDHEQCRDGQCRCVPGLDCVDGACGHEPWVIVCAGEFHMGSAPSELGADSDESEHAVRLTRDFLISSTEVTRTQYTDITGISDFPSDITDCEGACPAEAIGWHEAASYCNRLSAQEERDPCYECDNSEDRPHCELGGAFESPYDCMGYRLPTEAEWERAARAGTSTATYGGDLNLPTVGDCPTVTVLEGIAWYCANSGLHVHAVGGLEANSWGLHDMLGNVYEWCHDGYDTSLGNFLQVDPWTPPSDGLRVVRGGSYLSQPEEVRAAARVSVRPDITSPLGVGFRPVRTLTRRP